MSDVTTEKQGARTGESEVTCPACGAHNTNVQPFQFDSGRGLTPWARCSDCSTYFMTTSYDANYETDHSRDMAWGNEEQGAALNLRKKDGFVATLDRIEQLGYGESKILDVGCSFGGILMEANKRGFHCAGTDIVPEAVDYVRMQGCRAQECASLTDCTLYSQENPADVITVLDAHIYWPDQPGELRAAWDLLRDDGLIVIRAVTKSAFVTAGRYVGAVSPSFSRKLIRRAIADHRFSMPLKSLVKTVEHAGFEVLDATPRGAQHTNEMPLGARAAYKVGTMLWHGFGVSIAPTTLVFARKKAR